MTMSESEKLERSLLLALDPEIARCLPNAPLKELRKHVASSLRLKGVANAEGLVGLCQIAHAAPKDAANALRSHGFVTIAARIAQPDNEFVFGGTGSYQ
jgi:hypothetical protein